MNGNRRNICRMTAIVLLVLLAILTSPEARGQSSDERPVYVVAIDAEYTPYEFVDASGRATGFTVSLLNESPLNTHLHALKASGRYDALVAQWLPPSLREEGWLTRHEQKILWAVALLAILAAAFLIWNTALRRMVQRRTRELQESQAQAQLQANRLLTLIAHFPDGILLENAQREVHQTNQRFCELFDIPTPPEALLGANCRQAAEQVKHLFVDGEGFVQRIDEVITEQHPVLNEELQLVDGRTFVRDYVPIRIAGDKVEHMWHYRDITERKRAEEALRESEERYKSMYTMFRLMADNMPDLLWAKDIDRRFLFVNQSMCENLLLARDTDEPIGKNDMFFANRERQAHSDDPEWYTFGEICVESDSVVMSTRQPERFDEFGNVRGEFLHLDVYKAPVWDERGEMVGTVGCGRIVTREKQIEQDLRESEEKFRGFFEQAYEGITLIDEQGTIIEWNRAQEKITGLKQDDVIGRPAWDVQFQMAPEEHRTPEVYEQSKAALHHFFSTGQAPWLNRSQDVVIRRPDGTLRTIQQMAFSITTDKGFMMAGLVRDITEQARAAEALRESAQKYRGIFDESVAAIYVFDAKKNFIDANQAGLDLLGYSKEELLRMNIADVDADPVIVLPVHQQLVSGERIVNFEHQLKRKDGRIITVLNNSRPLSDAHGSIIGLQSTLIDITERKKMEEELLKTQKLESVGVLAGGIAHDFNNILTAILGNIGLAKMHTEPAGKVHERLAAAEKASLRARDLTQQLLTFSRGGAPITQATSIGNLVKDSASFAIHGSPVRCEFSFPDDPSVTDGTFVSGQALWPAEVDEGQMSRVISNLVINAVQAMPKGGTIRICAENVTVEAKQVPVLAAGRYVKVSIEDQGVGIPEKQLPKIFDPYFTTKEGGSGLGLAASYAIVKNHKGLITVESALGVGTTFCIYLPASSKEALAKPETGPPPPTGKGRVLVMDDEEIVREVACQMLGQIGYEVEFARDGAEAIELYVDAKEFGRPYAVVIMDLTVPGGMGGKEAIRRLRVIDPKVKAIVSSGYSNDPIMANFEEYGFSGVVAKPFGIQELSETLHGVISSVE